MASIAFVDAVLFIIIIVSVKAFLPVVIIVEKPAQSKPTSIKTKFRITHPLKCGSPVFSKVGILHSSFDFAL